MPSAAGRRGICSHGAQHGERPGASPLEASLHVEGEEMVLTSSINFYLPLGCVSRSERAFPPSGEGEQIHTHDHTRETVLSLGTGDSSSPLVYCSKGCRKQGIVKPQRFDSPANKSSASGQGCGPGLKSLNMGSSPQF